MRRLAARDRGFVGVPGQNPGLKERFSRSFDPGVTFHDDPASLEEGEPEHSRTVPFIPSELEMKVVQLLESGQAPVPTFGPVGADGLEAALRRAGASLAAGLRRHELPAARALRRSITAARVCEVAARTLGLQCEAPSVVGLAHNIGELWLFRLMDGISTPARLDEVLTVAMRYQAAAGAQLVQAWALPKELVQACRDIGGTGPGPNAHVRLARIAVHLTHAVEATLDGRTAEWDAAALSRLGVDRVAARSIVSESARTLTAVA
jgi:hypothetical protein